MTAADVLRDALRESMRMDPPPTEPPPAEPEPEAPNDEEKEQ